MAVIEDIKKLPKDEPKLKKYTLYGLLISLAVAIAMAIWYLIRYNQSGDNDSDTSWLWSLVHLVAYIAVGAFIGSALYGFFYGKSQLLLWYIFTVLAIALAEVTCMFYNRIILCKNWPLDTWSGTKIYLISWQKQTILDFGGLDKNSGPNMVRDFGRFDLLLATNDG